MNAVTLQFTYTEAEQVRAIRLYYDKNYNGKFDVLVCIVGIAFGLLLGTQLNDWQNAKYLFLLFGLLLTLIGYCYLVLPYKIYRNDPKVKEEYRLTFDDAGLHFQTKDIDSQIGWGLYNKVWRDRELIVLVHGKRTMTILPLRAFNSPADVEAMNSLLSRHIPARTKQ